MTHYYDCFSILCFLISQEANTKNEVLSLNSPGINLVPGGNSQPSDDKTEVLWCECDTSFLMTVLRVCFQTLYTRCFACTQINKFRCYQVAHVAGEATKRLTNHAKTVWHRLFYSCLSFRIISSYELATDSLRNLHLSYPCDQYSLVENSINNIYLCQKLIF